MSVIVHNEARELSPEEQEERAARCYQIEERIRENIAVGREAMWELMRNLHEFNEESGWTALGYEKQEDWLAQTEIGMTRTEYFRLLRRYRELVIRRGLSVAQLVELAPSKLDIVMPIIEQDKVPIGEVLGDVRSMGARDLAEHYIGSKRRSAPLPQSESNNGDESDEAPTDEAPTDEASVVPEDETPEDETPETPEAAVPEIIEGEARDVEPETQKSEEPPKPPAWTHTATAVDSWLWGGGDKRKARRNWQKLLREHPTLVALTRLVTLFDGEEGAPSRQEAYEDWKVLREALRLELETE